MAQQQLQQQGQVGDEAVITPQVYDTEPQIIMKMIDHRMDIYTIQTIRLWWRWIPNVTSMVEKERKYIH